LQVTDHENDVPLRRRRDLSDVELCCSRRRKPARGCRCRGRQGDYATPLRLWRPLADQDDADAQYNLGVILAEAAKWFRKAADQGNAGGQLNLGASHQDGEGVTQNFAEAMKWFRLAAEQGKPGAVYGVALLYENGRGVVQDDAEAVKWYRKAADRGFPRPRSILGSGTKPARA
jgi:uncharacterized protein